MLTANTDQFSHRTCILIMLMAESAMTTLNYNKFGDISDAT